MRNFFHYVFEIVGWILIFLSPVLLGSICGAVIFLKMPGLAGEVLAIIVGLLGIIIGAVWATRVWKKHGTINYLSRTSATPELEDKSNNLN